MVIAAFLHWLVVAFAFVDPIARALVLPLAVLFLLSGLDDLGIDLAWLYAWIEYRLSRKSTELPQNIDISQRKVAIFVPLWHEHQVIASMLEHNLASIKYKNYDFFVGVYPNDELTKSAVGSVANRFANVHMAVCPHDGPTSKADCLNWVFQHVGLLEEQTGERFDLIVTHDAEDIIHPDELHWINYYATRYDFVQIPVFALPTPFKEFTHGVYCDEFAECHSRDMVVRSRFRCFVPSAGVGTGYRREALERLADSQSNRIFEPEALTEDYENGLRLRRLGCSQVFASPWRMAGPGSDFVATREYFPQTWSTALGQRSRWVTGIALQSWERFGWLGSAKEVYWLWRDRKSLVGSPLGVVANLVFLYGVMTRMWVHFSAVETYLTWATLALQINRIAVRMGCVARIYGFVFSLGVPIRAVYGNALNAAATFQALVRYGLAKMRGEPLKWLKTEHAYPSRATLVGQKRRLGEILTDWGLISPLALVRALKSCPSGTRLGAHLITRGDIDEPSLYEALSFQQGLPLASLNSTEIPIQTARALPKAVQQQWQVLPFKIAEDGLSVAGPNLPSAEMTQELRTFTRLEIRYHLVTPTEYRELADTCLVIALGRYPSRYG